MVVSGHVVVLMALAGALSVMIFIVVNPNYQAGSLLLFELFPCSLKCSTLCSSTVLFGRNAHTQTLVAVNIFELVPL